MRVRLRNTWFAPTNVGQASNRSVSTSGRAYAPGTYDMPEEYRDILPSSAIVLDDAIIFRDSVHISFDILRDGPL